MTVFTHAKPPHARGEDFKMPSLTDQLADEPIESVVRRFMQNPYIPGNARDELVIDENNPDFAKVEEVFEDGATDDITKLDRIEREEILLEASRLAEQLTKILPQAKKVKTEEKSVKAPEVVTDVVKDVENAK